MLPKRKLCGLCSLLFVTTACGSSLYASVPVAPAVVVHACGVAEANAAIAGGRESVVDKTTIELERSSSEVALSADATYVKADAPTKEAKKTITVELNGLPTLEQCRAWGYVRQLGPNGCIPGASVFDAAGKLIGVCRGAMPPDRLLPEPKVKVAPEAPHPAAVSESQG